MVGEVPRKRDPRSPSLREPDRDLAVGQNNTPRFRQAATSNGPEKQAGARAQGERHLTGVMGPTLQTPRTARPRSKDQKLLRGALLGLSVPSVVEMAQEVLRQTSGDVSSRSRSSMVVVISADSEEEDGMDSGADMEGGDDVRSAVGDNDGATTSESGSHVRFGNHVYSPGDTAGSAVGPSSTAAAAARAGRGRGSYSLRDMLEDALGALSMEDDALDQGGEVGEAERGSLRGGDERDGWGVTGSAGALEGGGPGIVSGAGVGAAEGSRGGTASGASPTGTRAIGRSSTGVRGDGAAAADFRRSSSAVGHFASPGRADSGRAMSVSRVSPASGAAAAHAFEAGDVERGSMSDASGSEGTSGEDAPPPESLPTSPSDSEESTRFAGWASPFRTASATRSLSTQSPQHRSGVAAPACAVSSGTPRASRAPSHTPPSASASHTHRSFSVAKTASIQGSPRSPPLAQASPNGLTRARSTAGGTLGSAPSASRSQSQAAKKSHVAAQRGSPSRESTGTPASQHGAQPDGPGAAAASPASDGAGARDLQRQRSAAGAAREAEAGTSAAETSDSPYARITSQRGSGVVALLEELERDQPVPVEASHASVSPRTSPSPGKRTPGKNASPAETNAVVGTARAPEDVPRSPGGAGVSFRPPETTPAGPGEGPSSRGVAEGVPATASPAGRVLLPWPPLAPAQSPATRELTALYARFRVGECLRAWCHLAQQGSGRRALSSAAKEIQRMHSQVRRLLQADAPSARLHTGDPTQGATHGDAYDMGRIGAFTLGVGSRGWPGKGVTVAPVPATRPLRAPRRLSVAATRATERLAVPAPPRPDLEHARAEELRRIRAATTSRLRASSASAVRVVSGIHVAVPHAHANFRTGLFANPTRPPRVTRRVGWGGIRAPGVVKGRASAAGLVKKSATASGAAAGAGKPPMPPAANGAQADMAQSVQRIAESLPLLGRLLGGSLRAGYGRA